MGTMPLLDSLKRFIHILPAIVTRGASRACTGCTKHPCSQLRQRDYTLFGMIDLKAATLVASHWSSSTFVVRKNGNPSSP